MFTQYLILLSRKMAAVKSIGTTLTDTTDNLVIADLTSIGEIGIESDEIDVTTLDSSDEFREYIAGFKDAGELSFEGIIKSETAMGTMMSLANGRELKSWEIETANGSTWTFTGFVKSFKEGEASVDGVRNFTGSIRISGAPTYTGAVSA